jgi:hypothetical protein
VVDGLGAAVLFGLSTPLAILLPSSATTPTFGRGTKPTLTTRTRTTGIGNDVGGHREHT